MQKIYKSVCTFLYIIWGFVKVESRRELHQLIRFFNEAKYKSRPNPPPDDDPIYDSPKELIEILITFVVITIIGLYGCIMVEAHYSEWRLALLEFLHLL